jgi:phosphate transport system ATP-binding protein
MNVFDNVCFGLEMQGMPKKDRHRTALPLIDRLGLSDFMGHYPRDLSLGMRQRVGLARALVSRAEMLLMDEPCSALDPLSSGVVEDLIVSLRGRYTILIVTHNLAQARRIADYAVLFWVHSGAGRLIETGTAKQIFEAPRDPLTAAYVSGMRG